MNEPALRDVEFARDYLGVSTWMVYELCRRNELRYVRIGKGKRGALRFREAWLVAYAEAHASGPDLDDAAIWGGVGVPDAGRSVDSAVGATQGRNEAPTPATPRGHRGRGLAQDAGRPAGRGSIELAVSEADRKRGFVLRKVAD